MPPHDDESTACPTWLSCVATETVLTITPRWPF